MDIKEVTQDMPGAWQRYLYQMDKLLKKYFTIGEIVDLLPGHYQIYDVNDFSPNNVDRSAEKLFHCSLGGTLEQGSSLQESVMHPGDFEDLRPCLVQFIKQNDQKRVISFFQRIKGVNTQEYEWYFTTYKLTAYGLVSSSHAIRDLGDAKLQIEQVLEERAFFKRNFERFLSLTKREKEILKELALGKTALQIANEYFLSVNTVKTHRQRIFRKLEVKTFTGLYRYAFHFDLLA